MPRPNEISWLDRRSLLKGSVAAGALQIASPFIIKARAEAAIKIGMVDPLDRRLRGAGAKRGDRGRSSRSMQINAKGGILGRQIELLVEDSANDVGTGVQKARKLIERDQVTFIIGDVNSAIAQAIAQVTNEKKVLHIVSGGHTDTITGHDCKWNVYRVCNTTSMEANSISDLLFSKYGKKWHFITPDYAFGHTLQTGGRGRSGEARRHGDRQRAHAARHHRLLRLSHQGAGRQPRRPSGAATRRGHGQLPQADRAVRPQ